MSGTYFQERILEIFIKIKDILGNFQNFEGIYGNFKL